MKQNRVYSNNQIAEMTIGEYIEYAIFLLLRDFRVPRDANYLQEDFKRLEAAKTAGEVDRIKRTILSKFYEKY